MMVKKELFCTIAAMAFLTACGSDSGSASGAGENPGAQVDLSAATFDELPNCSEKREGKSALVEKDSSVNVCAGGKWKNLGMAVANEDALQNCTAKREGNKVYVVETAKGLICSDGKWVENEQTTRESEDDGDDVSSSSKKASSSSSEEDPESSEGFASSSSVSFPDGVVPAGYYKTHCPSGHNCKDATTSLENLNGDITYGEILDARDDQVYKVVTIGEGENAQTWMAQNLNYAPDENHVHSLGDNAWSGCYGEGNESYTEEQVAANCSKYGRLYTWEVVMDKAGCGDGNDCNNSYEGTQGICPEGWHLPSMEEFSMLLESVGSNDEEHSVNLRALSWGNGQDKYGFSALPAGRYDSNLEKFYYLGSYAHFWSSSEVYAYGAYRLSIGDYRANVLSGNKDYGISVRCLKD